MPVVEVPTHFDWRRRTAAGVVVTAIGLGMHEVLAGPRERPAVIQEYEEDPIREHEPIEVHLERTPEDTWAVVRPWLLAGHR